MNNSEYIFSLKSLFLSNWRTVVKVHDKKFDRTVKLTTHTHPQNRRGGIKLCKHDCVSNLELRVLRNETGFKAQGLRWAILYLKVKY